MRRKGRVKVKLIEHEAAEARGNKIFLAVYSKLQRSAMPPRTPSAGPKASRKKSESGRQRFMNR